MKIGLSTCGKPMCEQLFIDYKNAGIEAMELSYHKALMDELDFAQVAEYSAKYGVELWTLHVPFYHLAPDTAFDISNPDRTDATFDYFKSIIERASKEAKIKRFVVHPSSEPIDDADRKMRLDISKKQLSRLADVASKYDAELFVENLPRTCLCRNSEEMLEILDFDSRLVSCFDTNHLLMQDPSEYIKAINGKIKTLHVSDYDFIDEKHWIAGEGKIDWNKMYNDLKSIGYDGAWLYEVGFSLQKTRPERKRLLTCLDFANNAKEIFMGKKPTVITD